ncbi:MAG: hypothetical protein AB2L26_00325 [Ignavibacteria bacterium]
MSKQEVRLTQMVKSAGCAAKIFPYILSDALKDINWYPRRERNGRIFGFG